MEPVVCPYCQMHVANDGSWAGRTVPCPFCRGHFQMPHPTPTVHENAMFEEMADTAEPRSRPAQPAQSSQTVLWTVASLSLLSTIVAGLWLTGIIQVKLPKSPVAIDVNAELAAKSLQPSMDKDRLRLSLGKKDALRDEKETKTRDAEPNQKKSVPKSLESIVTLQAPPSDLGPGVMRNYGVFAQQMRELATNEFAFRKAQETVYRSTFNQRDRLEGLVANQFFAFNVILDAGPFDFDVKKYPFNMAFWYEYYKEGVGVGGRTIPETKDFCMVQIAVDTDPGTAARMREAYDKKSLSMTISYRLKRVNQGNWAANPHFNGAGRIAHNLDFEGDVIDFNWTSAGK